MKNWIVTSESGSCITKEEVTKFGIHIIPIHVSMGEENLDDGTFLPEKICQYYIENRQLPKK